MAWFMQIIREPYSSLTGITTVAVMADPGCRPGWKKNFMPLLKHVWDLHRPELFIVAGDLSFTSSPEEYQQIIGVMEQYPARIAAVPGDHDRPLKNFISYFGATRKVVDVDGWRFIGLNTANRRFTRVEAEFLDRNVKERSIIFTHLPPEAEGWAFHSMWPKSSRRFFEFLDGHHDKIHACFFGHIHGFSVRSYRGIPLIATGGVAESCVVHENSYQGRGFFEMMIFNVATGGISLCKMELSVSGNPA